MLHTHEGGRHDAATTAGRWGACPTYGHNETREIQKVNLLYVAVSGLHLYVTLPLRPYATFPESTPLFTVTLPHSSYSEAILQKTKQKKSRVTVRKILQAEKWSLAINIITFNPLSTTVWWPRLWPDPWRVPSCSGRLRSVLQIKAGASSRWPLGYPHQYRITIRWTTTTKMHTLQSIHPTVNPST